jgi:hypothetical protein
MFLYPQLVEITSHRDGKTATISTYTEKASGVAAIATNGKSDAALSLDLRGPATGDESTMILMGALPMALHPSARTAANIGLGSGLTTQTLLGNRNLRAVDTIEIEQAVVDAGAFFLPRVPSVYRDPRSRIIVDDAKTFFSAHQKSYDIIVSEPSNPWVSGVSGLFSEEFYELVKQHLDSDGLFAQWVQLYEIDNDLVLSILKTVSDSFSDYAVYSTNDRDMVIIARKQGRMPELGPAIFGLPEPSAALRRIDIQTLRDLNVRKIGNKRLFQKMLAGPGIRANSDYYPVLDQNAAQARFMAANAYDFPNLNNGVAPLLEMLAGDAPAQGSNQLTQSPHSHRSQIEGRALALRDVCLKGGDPGVRDVPPDVRSLAEQLLRSFNEPGRDSNAMRRQIDIYNAMIAMVPYLSPQELEGVWAKLESGKAAGTFSRAEGRWVDLFKGISRRNPRLMAASAGEILSSRQAMPPEVTEFVAATGMVGALVQGDQASARRIWLATRTMMFKDGPPDLLFRILASECGMPE